MRSKPVAKDLRRRSDLVQFSHKLSAHAFRPKPFLAAAVFGLVLMSAFSVAAASNSNTPGTIPGSAGVSATGAATYTIPISLPPGTNGMQPSLALVYNSQSGEGLAGYGWTLSGLSAITRCPWTIDDGGKTQGVQFGTVAQGHSDKFCLDGQRLLQKDGSANYGVNGMTYSTTVNNYAVITSYGTSGNSGGTNGPAYFTVQTKDGKVYEYGNTADSQIQAQWQGGTVRVWALDKVTDLNNNCMTYTYGGNGQGGNGFEYWPSTINYTGKVSGANCVSFDHQVQFTPTSRPQGSVVAQYQYGNLVTNSQLLHTIQITYAGSSTVTPTAFQYTLGYQQDSASGRNQLTSVTECSTVNAVTTCLNPTNISWQSAQLGWSADQSTGYATTDQAHADAAHLMDVDGDGIQDLVYPAPISSGSGTYDWFVMFGQPGGGFTAPVDTGEELWPGDNGYEFALAADVNGDGLMDLLVPIPCSGCSSLQANSGWSTLVSTGNRTPGLRGIFKAAPYEPPYLGATNATTNLPINQGNVWAVDFSGRGLSDIVYDDGTGMYLIKNGGPGNAYVLPPVQLVAANSISKPANQSFVDVPLDFDGSGRAGALLNATRSGAPALYALTSAEPPPLLSIMGGSNDFEAGSSPIPLDANGDGLTDVLYILNTGTKWQIGLSTGTGFNNLSSGVVADTTSGLDPIVADYDNSGRQTAIVHSTDSNWYTLSAVDGTGNTFSASSSIVGAPYPSGYVQGTLRIGNIEANGMDDLVYGITNPNNGNVVWHIALHKGSPWPPDTVTNVTDGLGNYVNFVYGSLASGAPLYTESTTAVQYPIRNIQPAMQVVSSLAASNGAGGANHYTYTYSGAQTELQGRGFLGFASRQIVDEAAGTTETIQYAQSFPYTGMVTSDKLKSNSSNTLISDTENSGLDSVAVSLPFGTAYLPFFKNSVASTYNYNGASEQLVSATTTILSKTDFDTYGNYTGESTAQPGTYQVSTADGGSGTVFASNKTTSFAYGSTNYCVGIPSATTIVRTVGANTTSRAIVNNVDTSTCRLNSQTVEDSGDTVSASTSYDSYDGWGNVTQTTVSGTNVATPRVTAYSFQGGNNEFLTSTTYTVSSSEQLTTQSTWDYSLGFKLSDIDANGKSTSYAPDAFGRLASVTRRDSTQTQYKYFWCSSAPYTCPSLGVYEVTTTQVPNDSANPAIITGYTVYDSEGRPVEQGTKLLGGVMSLVDTTYDALGHVTSVTRPYFSGSSPLYQTVYTWDDAFNRVTKVTAPANQNDTTSSGNVTQFSYNVVNTGSLLGFDVTASSTSTTSSLAENTSKYTDALGETTAMVDANGGSTLYSYDPFGDLTQTTDADENVTKLGYDGLGHKTSMTDPDMGTWSYKVDALGEVLCQTDANNQSIIFGANGLVGYDGLGRVVNKLATAPGAGCNATTGTASSWTYDQAGALGLPATVSDSNGFQRAYAYDPLERPSYVTTTIPGNSTPYTVSTSYDDFSRVATVTYPVSVTPSAAYTPVANATPASATVLEGVAANFDGSHSTDPNGLPLSYAWSQTSGPMPGGTFSSANTATTGFSSNTPGNYTLQLQVEDADYNSASTSVTVQVQPPAPGSAPTIASGDPSTTGVITLSWLGVSGATSYEIYDSVNGGAFSPLQTVNGATTATVTVQGGGTYHFTVAACGNGVCGPQSGESSLLHVNMPPAIPTGLTVSPSDTSTTGNYTLSWNAVSSSSTYPVSYQVYEESSGGAYGQLGSTTTSTSEAVTANGGGTYTYYVEACNSYGCSSPSNTVTETVSMPLAPPGAPGTVNANPWNILPGGAFTLSWGAAIGNVGYYLFVNTNTQYSASTLSLTLNAPTKTGWYTYSVKACNAAGCSAATSKTVEVSSSGSASTFKSPYTGAGDHLSGAAPMVAFADTSVRPEHANMDAVIAGLSGARRLYMPAQAHQAPEAVMQAEAARYANEETPALLPVASAQDIAAWNTKQSSHMARDPMSPHFAPPTFISYGGMRASRASGTPYQFAVSYSYDPSSGALISVQNTQTQFVYWKASTAGGSTAPVDAFGHLLAYTDGNNVSTVNSYDAATGAITGIGTGIGQSSAIQQLTYAWNGFGNLEGRCDVNRGMLELFGYDALNRLKASTVTTGASTGSCSASTPGPAIGVNYDPVGNIQSLSNSGNSSIGGVYTYDPNHPHAVSTVANIAGTNTYDANGNMVCRFGTWNGSTCAGGTQITWNADNLPTQITGPNGSSSFSYGPDLQRYSQTATDSSGNVTNTTYIGGLFEVVSTSTDTQYRHNIMAGGAVVAVHTIHQSGTVETDYIHSDHLGSGDVITTDSGNIATDPVTGEQQVMSFDAFGLRRDPNNWSYDLTATQIGGLKAKTDRGYTFQEQLDNVGLVHMNGRVYDPAAARFISADPTVPNPLYSQAFDRYAYVYNNPLSATDPTGFDSCDQGNDCSNDTGSSQGNHDDPETGSHIGGDQVSTGCTGCAEYGFGAPGTIFINGSGSVTIPKGVLARILAGVPINGLGKNQTVTTWLDTGYYNGANVHISYPSTCISGCSSAWMPPNLWLGTVSSSSSSNSESERSHEGTGNSPGVKPQTKPSPWIYLAMVATIIAGGGPEDPVADAGAAAEYAAATTTEVVEGAASSYIDTTAEGALVTNITTDVTADEAAATLESNGYTPSISADGQATTFTNAEGNTFTIRPSNSAPGGAAIDFQPASGGPPVKINLGSGGGP